MAIRSPVCTVVGHVDHGKSSILDRIRGTAIVSTEAGKITQAIGASIIPLHVIKKIAGPLLESLGIDFTIPGLLFIDTPGHAAFTSLRKRGGSLADIAILVVDINEGFKPQTIEALEILKQSKTPFVIAANKVDLLPGWKKQDEFILQNIAKQNPSTTQSVETKLYELVGKVYEFGFEAERFDRVQDYTKQIAIIPTSAETGEGIPELLMVIAGLAQKYLENSLHIDEAGMARGTILEIKEERGFGKTLDVIIYDGTMKANDTLVIGNIGEPITTRIKALLEPKPLVEMRDTKAKFNHVKEAIAATGVKIAAPDIDNAVAGMPIIACSKEQTEEAQDLVQKEVNEVLIETETDGIIIKADTIGSLEAMIFLLKEHNIPVRKAAVGDITKTDMVDAHSNYEKDPLLSVILGFNVKCPDEIRHEQVKVITSDIIYRLLEDLQEWQESEKKRIEMSHLDNLTKPCKLEILKGYIFRQSNPAVVGVEVLQGTLKNNSAIMNSAGNDISRVRGIQSEQKSVEKAEKGKQIAISMDGVTVGRQINEGDIIYSSISEDEYRQFKENKTYLEKEDVELLKEIATLKRKHNPVWGV